MSVIDLLFLSIALAMDCFAISIVCGVIMRKHIWRIILQISFFFGLFQAFMPLAGWFGINNFSNNLEAFDHWIAFGLLAFIGGKMVKESFETTEEVHFSPGKLRTQLILAVATSIDALAVGISFACIGYKTFFSLILPLVMIGATSFIFGVVGNVLGVSFGNGIAHKLKPELLGGIILILIGIKILMSHLL